MISLINILKIAALVSVFVALVFGLYMAFKPKVDSKDVQQQKLYNIINNKMFSQLSTDNLSILKNNLNNELINLSKNINEEIIKTTNRTNLTESELQNFQEYSRNCKISIYIYFLTEFILQNERCIDNLNNILTTMKKEIPDNYYTPLEFGREENEEIESLKTKIRYMTSEICDGAQKCGDILCNVGEACCNEQCIYLSNNNMNCGSCGNKCPEGSICCDGECKDPQTFLSDNNNCGLCGTICTPAYTGSRGRNFPAEICCEGKCRLPYSFINDDNNCGLCGNKCPEGSICCNGGCIDPQTFLNDDNNCGLCGTKCNIPYEKCCEGTCVNVNIPTRCGNCNTICDENSPDTSQCNLNDNNEYVCGPQLG